MVSGAIAGNISAEATTPTGNTFVEATRGLPRRDARLLKLSEWVPMILNAVLSKPGRPHRYVYLPTAGSFLWSPLWTELSFSRWGGVAGKVWWAPRLCFFLAGNSLILTFSGSGVRYRYRGPPL